MLFIAANVTSEANIGSYPIKLQLIDEKGALSDWMTLTLKIIPAPNIESNTDLTIPSENQDSRGDSIDSEA